MNQWTTNDIPNLAGKIAIVTGANSGLGYETTKALAGKGAHVILACRNSQRGEVAAGEIRSQFPTASLEVMTLDLADLASIHRFADAFARQHQSLHILCNNAGVMALPYCQTADGFELQFGINHLGHFALTGLLIGRILRTGHARVVTVSSNLHKWGQINFADLNSEKSYHKWRAYNQSKLANLLFAYELQRKFEAAGANAISVAAHPGYAATNLQLAGPRMQGSTFQIWLMSLSNRFVAQSAAMGALPILYAATSPDVQGGDYVGPGGFMEVRGFPKKTRSSGSSYDQEKAAKLWAVSEELTGVRYAAQMREMRG
jgi:hypothetical protein